MKHQAFAAPRRHLLHLTHAPKGREGRTSCCAGRVGGERAARRWAQPSPMLAAHASWQVEHTTDIDRVWRKSLAMTRMVRRIDTRNPHELVLDFAMTTSDAYDT